LEVIEITCPFYRTPRTSGSVRIAVKASTIRSEPARPRTANRTEPS
jgi:hypothetical protein